MTKWLVKDIIKPYYSKCQISTDFSVGTEVIKYCFPPHLAPLISVGLFRYKNFDSSLWLTEI